MKKYLRLKKTNYPPPLPPVLTIPPSIEHILTNIISNIEKIS